MTEPDHVIPRDRLPPGFAERIQEVPDEYRSPVLAGDLASALVDLAGTDGISGVLHLGGPDPLSRAELARMTAERHGWDASGLRFSTIEASGLDRPGRVVLDSSLARSHGLGVRGPTAWL